MEECRFVSIFIITQPSVLLMSGAPCLAARVEVAASSLLLSSVVCFFCRVSSSHFFLCVLHRRGVVSCFVWLITYTPVGR